MKSIDVEDNSKNSYEEKQHEFENNNTKNSNETDVTSKESELIGTTLNSNEEKLKANQINSTIFFYRAEKQKFEK